MMLLRHIASIALLPFVVVVVVPYWLLADCAVRHHWWGDGSSVVWTLGLLGSLIFVIGFVLFSCCIFLFARVGRGTLAPWDPPRHFVAVGPYRFVRNPMISGVVSMLLGEALFWGSGSVGLWACLFLAVNHVYFVLSEEPALEKRFGESYRTYRENVPRWIPRLRPWQGP